MVKYYTRPCNFYYGNYARYLVKSRKALSLAGNSNIAFDQVEIIERKKKRNIKNNFYNISEIKNLNKAKKNIIKSHLKKITFKRKNILGLKFNKPNIMGVLNVTPDSFSDGGKFFNNEKKAYKQTISMIDSGATIIDIGGESTRPGSKIVQDKDEWKRIEKIILKVRKNFPNLQCYSCEINKEYYELASDEGKTINDELEKCGVIFYEAEKGIKSFERITNDLSGFKKSSEEPIRRYQEAVAHPVNKDEFLRCLFSKIS
mgnify:CR=1 FL=1